MELINFQILQLDRLPGLTLLLLLLLKLSWDLVLILGESIYLRILTNFPIVLYSLPVDLITYKSSMTHEFLDKVGSTFITALIQTMWTHAAYHM